MTNPSNLQTATAPAPASTSAAAVDSLLSLEPPKPVAVVKPEQTAGMIPLSPEKQADLERRAKAYADRLCTLQGGSPEFAKEVDSINALGRSDMQRAAAVPNGILERSARSIPGGKKAGGAQLQVADTLGALRHQVEVLDPGRADLRGARKILGLIPMGDKIQQYFERYQSSQAQLNAIIKALESGRAQLASDNVEIEKEKANLWTVMGKLSEYQALTAALDDAVSQKIAELQAAGNEAGVTALTSDALFAIRQRRQDIMTQMAVSAQGYLALDLVRKNNIELMKGVDRAQTTTISALRTAVIVSVALCRQKLVLDQITALNTTTSNLIEATSRQLQLQGAAINEQAAASTIDITKLQAAFDNVFQTMDAIDTFRIQATDTMKQSVDALEGQVERAKPYLERTRAQEGNKA